MNSDILDIVRKTWPSDSHNVDDWPVDERIVYREARDQHGIEFAHIMLDLFRQRKMADAVAKHVSDNLLDYM